MIPLRSLSTKLYKKLYNVVDDLESLIIIVGTFMRNLFEYAIRITSSRLPVLYIDNHNVPAIEECLCQYNVFPVPWGKKNPWWSKEVLSTKLV